LKDGHKDKVAIQPAQPEHAREIATVSRISYRAALPDVPELHTPEEDADFYAEKVLSTNRVLIAVGVPTGAILGFIAFTTGWVNQFYLLPSFRRKGIGRELLDRAKDQSDFLQLWTFQANDRARAFYRSQGFAEVRWTEGEENEERQPDVLLEWRRPLPEDSDFK
jgi:putative acetyltransferase